MVPFELAPGERRLHRSNANFVVVPADYGLSRFAADGLLPLVGMAGKEAIGGRVHVTSARVVFSAHPVNRLKGVFAIPLPEVTGTAVWRHGISLGFEVATSPARFTFVSWSRRAAVSAIEQARSAFGASEQAILEGLRGPSDLEVRPGAEALNLAAAALFRWGR